MADVVTGEEFVYRVGDLVAKCGGDYTFEGEVRSAFHKKSGKARYVVEDDRGCLHIYSANNLQFIHRRQPT